MMRIKLITAEGRECILCDVEAIYVIPSGYTQVKELKNTILIIHRMNHIEKFRLYQDANILSIKEEA